MISVFKKLSWYFKEQWLKYTLAISALIVVNILGVIPPILVGRVIDLIQYNRLTQEDFTYYVVLFISILVVSYLLSIYWDYTLFGRAILLEENAFKANGPFYANDIAFLRTISNGRFDGS